MVEIDDIALLYRGLKLKIQEELQFLIFSAGRNPFQTPYRTVLS